MRNAYGWGLAVLASMWVLAGCGSGAKQTYQPKKVKEVEVEKIQPGQEMTLLPLAVGNQWTYSAEEVRRVNGQQATRNFELTLRVAAVNPLPNGGKQAQLEVLVDGKVQERQTWRVTPQGIYQLTAGANSTPFTPAQLSLPFPIEEGKEFKWTGTGPTPAGNTGRTSYTSEILGMQLIDTDMGRKSALSVQSNGTFSITVPASGNQKARTLTGRAVNVSFWTPNVGISRYRLEVGIGDNVSAQTLRLKAYMVK